MLSTSHRRFNPLTGEYILVSPHRGNRPWQGANEQPDTSSLPSYEPQCYLCPGNTRINDEVNPDYNTPFVFDNDFPALSPSTTKVPDDNEHALFQSEATSGKCRVICYSADHSKTLPEMSAAEIAMVIDTWTAQVAELGSEFNWVQVFENKGEVMGCSQPHPHGQIWASSHLPNEVAIREKHLTDYQAKRGGNLLLDYAQQELDKQERVVVETQHWVAVVPYWAMWPFETMLMPKHRVIARFDDLTENERIDLADAIKELTTRYDNLFKCAFPYSMGWYYAPLNQEKVDHWQLHAVFYPPLLRSKSVKKFMVGYEMLAEAQRDITPESAAQRLQELSTVHYKEQAQCR